MTIAIADNSFLSREKIKNIITFNRSISIVGEAQNEEEAIQLVLEKQPDLIIIDIQMSESKSIKILQKIKMLSNKTQICVFTNYLYPQFNEVCLAAGADYFCDKNMEYREIKNQLVRIVSFSFWGLSIKKKSTELRNAVKIAY